MRNVQQRREQILQLVARDGSVQITQLVPQLGVSAVTIRSDLGALESQGRVTRSHGGATPAPAAVPGPPLRQKDPSSAPLKERIGRAAALRINAGDNILIGSGATTLSLARHLGGLQQLTVMTNSLDIAWELADAPGVELMLTGGLLRKQRGSMQGAQAEAGLNAYNFDKLFLGVDGLDLQVGITAHDGAQARLNCKMVERAKKVFVLTDSSKFNRVSLHRVLMPDRIHTVITDAGISPEYRDGLQRLGIEVIIAD